ncbi:MAG TPA: SDR family oxidoreductase [Anaerolineales bacterium]|nr:SDR family oxidoreductase [Anaerolineales bacterium]
MRTAIVTGANRGVGREIAKQLVLLGYRVILTSRDKTKGKRTSVELKEELGTKVSGELIYHQLDVTSCESIQRLHDFVASEGLTIDALINNAAVLFDQCGRLLQTSLETYRATMETNVYGPLMLCQKFIPMMLEHNYGRVVNVSSGAGQVGDMVNDMTAYRLSKLALNGLTLMLANSLAGTNVLVNAGCPGWVRTDMGSPNAPRSAEEGAEGIVWLATLPDGGPQGGFFRDKELIGW